MKFIKKLSLSIMCLALATSISGGFVAKASTIDGKALKPDTETNLPSYSSIDAGFKSGNKTFKLVSNSTQVKSTVNSAAKLVSPGQITPMVDNYSTVTIDSSPVINYSYDFGKHPQASNSYYYADAYYFSFSQSVDFISSFAVGYGPISVTVSSLVSTGGYSVNVPGGSSVRSIPIAKGQLIQINYTVRTYSPTGTLLSTQHLTKYGSQNVQGWYRLL